MPLTLLTEDGKVIRTQSGSGGHIDAFFSELGHCVETVNSGSASSLLDGTMARDALLLCHREAESVTRGKIVKV
jgi:hypothetical protein